LLLGQLKSNRNHETHLDVHQSSTPLEVLCILGRGGNSSGMKTLAQMADDVLRTPDGRTKTAISREYAAVWKAARDAGETPEIGTASPPDMPARPAQPELLDPRDVPRRKT
jgi:hypothetical protein